MFIEKSSVQRLREVLSQQGCNIVTFQEPHIGGERPFPHLPDNELTSFQLWFINKPWEEELSRSEVLLKEHFGKAAQPLITQMNCLLKLFTELTGDSAPFVSLRTITKDYFGEQNGASVSAGWHRDASVLTLQHTLSGETLEWTPNSNVRREYFEQTQIQPFSEGDNSMLMDAQEYQTLPFEHVAILKGELRPNEKDPETIDFLENFISTKDMPAFNIGNGLIHRGNAQTKYGRLVLTISTHKLPEWLPA